MDALKKIAELKAEREALEQQLAVPGISENEDLAIRQQIIALDNRLTGVEARLPESDIYLPVVSWLTGRNYPANWNTAAAYVASVGMIPVAVAGAFWRCRLAFFFFRMNRAVLPRTTIAKYKQQHRLAESIEQLQNEAADRGLRWEKDAAVAAGQSIFAFLTILWTKKKLFSPPTTGGGK